ncbi:suppressor APC domain-containing protein 2-like [Penaeus indicus]|uniref:suppressor APC domain-containing protein 2-like n=1 Tax=Penaeus indicus TaxID=29960 RepID=UPI00300DAB64
MTATQTAGGFAALDGLPKPFVNAMRTLFDIMDDQRTGYVKFSEIERRWQDDGTQGMPRGVLGSLRKVTPPDGYLSFERFCAGLQISLLRNKMDDPSSSSCGNSMPAKPGPPPTKSSSISSMGPPPPSKPSIVSSMGPPPLPHSRPPSAPLLDEEHSKQPRTNANMPSNIRSNIGVPQHHRAERTMSMPHLDEPLNQHDAAPLHQYDHADVRSHAGKPDIKMGVGGIMGHSKSMGNMQGPPKPPRVLERDRGTHSLDRNLENRGITDHPRIPSDIRGTHSLERDHSERKWSHERLERPHRERERSDYMEFRRERGSSLERLLDPEEKANHVPLGRAGIRSALQTWHKERSKGDLGDNNNNNKIMHEKEFKEPRVQAVEPMGRGVGDGGDSTRAAVVNHSEPTALAAAAAPSATAMAAAAPTNKRSSRRREPRRHTLQNGIDNNMLRRLKQLEAERDMLVQGYEVVERARAWYRQQLQGITERIHQLPHGPPKHEPSIEAQQEKLHFQLARIHEVNAHLQALMEATERGLPTHMNLAIRPMSSALPHTGNLGEGATASSRCQGAEAEDQDRVIDRLKDQNHLLTEEVSNKSERITALEREKAALLRELFQSRSSHHHPQVASADSTFM